MNYDGLNEKIGSLLESTEYKVIPYIGWFWRRVDFESVITLGIIPSEKYVGFMENNKWGYPTFDLTKEQSNRLIELIENLISEPNDVTKKTLQDYMQSFLEIPNIRDMLSGWLDPYEEMYAG